MVLLQQLANAIVGQRIDVMIVSAGHTSIVDERVDDRFFSSFNDTGEDRIHPVVRNGLNRTRDLIGICRARVRR